MTAPARKSLLLVLLLAAALLPHRLIAGVGEWTSSGPHGGTILNLAADELEDTFWRIMYSPAAAFPPVYYETLGIYRVSMVFRGFPCHSRSASTGTCVESQSNSLCGENW